MEQRTRDDIPPQRGNGRGVATAGVMFVVTPFFNGYRPQFYFRTTDVTGVATLPKEIEMVMPGDNVSLSIELITPIAMEKEQRFAIREGGKTVGAGVVSEVEA